MSTWTKTHGRRKGKCQPRLWECRILHPPPASWSFCYSSFSLRFSYFCSRTICYSLIIWSFIRSNTVTPFTSAWSHTRVHISQNLQVSATGEVTWQATSEKSKLKNSHLDWHNLDARVTTHILSRPVQCLLVSGDNRDNIDTGILWRHLWLMAVPFTASATGAHCCANL